MTRQPGRALNTIPVGDAICHCAADMNVEHLPFFEDEFFLRATDPGKWDLVVDALRDLRETDDDQAVLRAFATLNSLLSLYTGEGADNDLVPILARRFGKDLKESRSEHAFSTLLALESAIAKHQFKEDCPSLEECIKQDELRREFIESGQWTDVNVAYEHTLQKQIEQERAKHRVLKQRKHMKTTLIKVLTIPLLILLPIGLFAALIVQYQKATAFSGPFMVACAVLFSLQACSMNIAFSGIILDWKQLLYNSGVNSSVRVGSAVTALILCIVSVVIAYRRNVNSGDFISTSMCAPLALCQLYVGIIASTLLRDFSKVQKLVELDDSAETKGSD